MDPVNQHTRTGLSLDSTNISTRNQLSQVEEMDILVLNRFVRPLYQPSESPMSFVVGYSSLREAEILRGFHESSYGLTGESVKVIGCNIVEHRSAGTTDSLDRLYMGNFRGDAKECYTWLKGFMDLGIRNRYTYDLAYIRNPDLCNIREWGATFARAVEMTAPTGVIVTLVREDDVRPFERLADYLGARYRIQPALVTETGMCVEHDSLKQHFLLGAFKGKRTCV